MGRIEAVSWDTFRDLTGSVWKPVALVVEDKIYPVGSWENCFQVFFSLFAETNAGEQTLLSSDASINSCPECIVSSDPERLGRNPFVKVSDRFYVRVWPSSDTYNNIVLLSSFQKRFNECVGRLTLYVTSSKNYALEKEVEEFLCGLEEETRSKRVDLVHHIGALNKRILTSEEAFVHRVWKHDFDQPFIGDIVLPEEETSILWKHLASELRRLALDPDNFKPKDEKLFAFGIAVFGQKLYAEGRFWPSFEHEFSVRLPVKAQKKINECVRASLQKAGKKVIEEKASDGIQTILMQSFVCDSYANDFFEYLFAFWRIELRRNIENLFAGNQEKHNLLLAEIQTHQGQVKVQTAQAVRLIEEGEKRVEEYLGMIDSAFWNDGTLPEGDTDSRVYHLLQRWAQNPASSFQKDLRANERKKYERGAPLRHSPTLCLSKKEGYFEIILPLESFEEDAIEKECVEASWEVDFGGEKYEKQLPLCKRGTREYVEEARLPVPFSPQVFGAIQCNLRLDNGTEPMSPFQIEADTLRAFYNGELRVPKEGCLPRGEAVLFFDDAEKPLRFEGFSCGKASAVVPGVNIFSAILDEGGVLSLLDRDILIGKSPEDRLSEEGLCLGAFIEGLPVYSLPPTLRFCATKEEKESGFLQLNERRFPLVKLPLRVVGREREGAKSVCSLALPPSALEEGVNSLLMRLGNANSRERKVDFAYLPDLDFAFDQAPYLFSEKGVVSFSGRLPTEVQEAEKKIEEEGRRSFVFSFEKFHGPDLKVTFKEENGNGCDVRLSVPSFRYRFSNGGPWIYRRPAPIFHKDLPDRVQVGWGEGMARPRFRVYLDGHEDISHAAWKPASEGSYVADYSMSDLISRAGNRTKRIVVSVEVGSLSEPFLEVNLRSEVLNVNVYGDVDRQEIRGQLEIQGRGEYCLSISKDGVTVAEEVPLDEEGKFVYKGLISPGTYGFDVYERECESDDIFFDPEYIRINDERMYVQVQDLERLDGHLFRLKGWKEAGSALERPRPLTNIRISRRVTLEEMREKMEDQEDEFLVNSNAFEPSLSEWDENTLFYEGWLFEEGQESEGFDVMLIYRDKFNPGDPVILRDVPEDSHLNLLIFDVEERRLVRSDREERFAAIGSRRHARFQEIDDARFAFKLHLLKEDERGI